MTLRLQGRSSPSEQEADQQHRLVGPTAHREVLRRLSRRSSWTSIVHLVAVFTQPVFGFFHKLLRAVRAFLSDIMHCVSSAVSWCDNMSSPIPVSPLLSPVAPQPRGRGSRSQRGVPPASSKASSEPRSNKEAHTSAIESPRRDAPPAVECVAAAAQVASESLASRARGVIQPAARWVTETITGLFAAGQKTEQGALLRQSKAQRQQRLQRQQKPQQKQQQQRQLQRQRLQLQLVEKNKQREQTQQYTSNQQKQDAQLSNKQQHQQFALDGPQPQQQHQQQHSKPLEKQQQQRQAAHSVELEDSTARANNQEQSFQQAVVPAAGSTTASPARRQAAATNKRRQAASRAQASKKMPAESAAARAAALLAAAAEVAEAAAQDAAAHSTSASLSEADLAPVAAAAAAAEEAAAKKLADSRHRSAATDVEADPAEQVMALKPNKGKKRQLANAQTQRTADAPPSPLEESAAVSAKAESAAEVAAAASAEAGAAAAESSRTSEAVAPDVPRATSLVEVAKVEGGSGEASGFTVIEGRSRKPKSQQKRQPISAPEEAANAARQDASKVLVRKHQLHQHHMQAELEHQKQLPPERLKESDPSPALKSLAAFKCMETKSSRAGRPASRGQQWWEREQRQGEKHSAHQQSPKQHQQHRQQRSEEPPDNIKRQEPQRHSHGVQQQLERQAASGQRKQHLTQHQQQKPPQEPLQQQQQQPPQEPLQQHQHQRPPQEPQQHHQHQPPQEPQQHQHQHQQPPQEPQQQQQQHPQEPQQQQQQQRQPQEPQQQQQPSQEPQQQPQRSSQEPQQQQQQPPRQPQSQLVQQQQQQQPSQHPQQQLQQRRPQHQQQHHRTTSANVLAHSPQESRRNSVAPQRRRGWVAAESQSSAAEAPSVSLPDKEPAQAEGTNGVALSGTMRSNDLNSMAVVKENAEAMRATTPAAAAVAAKEGWRWADLHGDRSPRPPAHRKFDKKPDGRASPEARQEAGSPAKPRGPHNWVQIKPAHCADIERLAPAGALPETRTTNAEAVAAIPQPQQRRTAAPEPAMGPAPKAEEEAARHWPTLGASTTKANRRKSASSASRIEQEKPVLQSQRVGAHQHQPRHQQQQQQQCLHVHEQQPQPRATPRAWEAPRYRRGRRGQGGWTSPTEAHRQTTAPVPETLRGSGCASECGAGRCDSVSVSMGTPDAEWGGFEDSGLPRTGRPPKGREPYSPKAGPSSRSAAPTQASASVAGTYTAGTHASAAAGCSGSCPYLSVVDIVALSAPRGTLASHLIGVESEWWQRQLQQPQQPYQPRNRPYQQGWDRRRSGSVASQLVLRRQLVQQQMVVCDAEFAVLVAVLPDPCYDPYAAAAAAATASYSCPSTTYGAAYAASMGVWGSIGPQTPCHAAYLPPYQPPLKGAFYGPEPPGSLHDYPLQQEPRTPQATPLPGTPGAHLQHTQLSFAAVNGDPEHQGESGHARQREVFHVSAAPGQLPSDAGSAEKPAQQLSSPHAKGATNGDTEPPEPEQQMNASAPIQHAAPATEATN